MKKKPDINEFALSYFGFRLLKQDSEYVEYTDGSRILLINKEHFRYYSKNTAEPVPIPHDIVMFVEIVRKELLHYTSEYLAFGPFDVPKRKKKVQEVKPNEEH